MSNLPVVHGNDYRASTDAAGLCGAIVKQTASDIQGRRYVSVEGWQAIAIAHGCAAGSRDVEKIDGGVRAVGEIRRMSDGQIIATAEGFVGEDEPTWYGGKNKWGKEQPKRADYAIRAMAQTRAISRACRSAFAHVVVMIDAGLSTTPAEEVPDGGFIDATYTDVPAKQSPLKEQIVESVAQAEFPEGPAKNITALKAATRQLWREITGTGDEDELNSLLWVPENKALLAQLEALTNSSHRELWSGDGKDNPGISGLIAQKRNEFKNGE